jgi:hypothetical protein
MRITVAAGILIASLAVLMLPTAVAAYRNIAKGNATGIGFAVGSPAENALRLLVVLALALLAFWLSGRVIRA